MALAQYVGISGIMIGNSGNCHQCMHDFPFYAHFLALKYSIGFSSVSREKVSLGQLSRSAPKKATYATTFTGLTEGKLMLHCKCLTFPTPF